MVIQIAKAELRNLFYSPCSMVPGHCFPGVVRLDVYHAAVYDGENAGSLYGNKTRFQRPGTLIR